MFKVNNRNIWKSSEVSSKSTIKEPAQGRSRHSDVFIVNFEYIPDLFQVFLLLILKRKMLLGLWLSEFTLNQPRALAVQTSPLLSIYMWCKRCKENVNMNFAKLYFFRLKIIEILYTQ